MSPKRTTTTSSSSPARGAERVETPAPPSCPVCGGKLVAYQGDNPHKQGTAVCQKCGTRTQLTTE